MSKQYMVIGGVYTDFTFTRLSEGSKELYGPFESYQDAMDAWKAGVWRNVDNAQHRLKIQEIQYYNLPDTKHSVLTL